MTASPHPTLAEDLLLLGLDPDRSRRLVQARHLSWGVAGAALAELALRGAVEERGGRVVVVNPLPVGQPLLDAALAELSVGKKGGDRPKAWVRGHAEWLENLALDGLVGRGVVDVEERRVLGVFPSTRLHVQDPAAHAAVLAAFHSGSRPGAGRRAAVLAALASAVELPRRLGVPWRTRRELAGLARTQWPALAVHRLVAADNASAAG
ncbi:GPP34 family phosphoprotein [Streptomyces sp. NPDC059740]|uniref:GOLPH3/VPS74 family protein n=1 Tax=Streptomyces sp. NPDC059740 TaxID=3346926 RepID=UPI0036559AE2